MASLSEPYKINNKEKLQEALNLRDEFIAICSHELKLPITSMRLQFQIIHQCIEQLELVEENRNKIKRLLEISIDQLDRFTGIIDDMLDVAKISSGQLEINLTEVDLCELVMKIVERFVTELDSKKIQIKINCNPPAIVKCDSLKIDQVITNLLSNGIKYGSEKPIHIAVEKGPQFIQLMVQDFGIGIPKENQGRIFSRYVRVNSHHNPIIPGLGLGLYIARKIVEAHGGRIELESEVAKGSKFTVMLPYELSGQVA